MSNGKEYEKLIERMYRQLAPNAIVKYNDKIIGRDSETKRQIDVSIRYKFANVDHLVIVEAKDHKIPINVKAIDGFSSVIKEVGANKGIIVSAKGFSDAALAMAKNRGIEALTVHSAENKDWSTLIKCKVNITKHTFDFKGDFFVNIEDLQGKQVYYEPDLFSYDMLNIIEMKDVINEEILQKHTWREIIRPSGIKLDLRGLGLYSFFNNEFRPVGSGSVFMKYLKTKKSQVIFDPVNYLYEINHNNDVSKLHNLTIEYEMLNKLIKGEYDIPGYELSNFDESNAEVEITLYEFKDYNTLALFKFNLTGGISGNAFHKDNRIMGVSDRSKRIIEIEDISHMKKGFKLDEDSNRYYI